MLGKQSLLVSVSRTVESRAGEKISRKCVLSGRDVLVLSDNLRYTLLDTEGNFAREVADGDLSVALGAHCPFAKNSLDWFDLVSDSTIVTVNLSLKEIVFFDLSIGRCEKKAPISLSCVPVKCQLFVKADIAHRRIWVAIYDQEKHNVEVSLFEIRSGNSKIVYKGNIHNLNVVKMSLGCLLLGNQSGQKNPLEILCLHGHKQLMISGQFKDKDIILNYGFLDKAKTCLFMLFNKKKGKKSGIYLADVPLDDLTKESDSASLQLLTSTKVLQRVILFTSQKQDQDILLGEAVFNAEKGLAAFQGWQFTHLFTYTKGADHQWVFTPIQSISYDFLNESSLESKDLLLYKQQGTQPRRQGVYRWANYCKDSPHC